MRHETFQTPEPIDLVVEIGSGAVRLHASDDATTEIQIEGATADDVTVTQDGRRVRVVGPKSRGVFAGDHRLDVQVSLPSGSDVTTRTGSADVTTHGSLGEAQLKTGSGRVDADAFTGSVAVSTGSGAVSLRDGDGDVAVKTGSGAVELSRVGAACAVSTGSGAVRLGSMSGPAAVKSGSGDLTIDQAGPQTEFKTGSGSTTVREVRSGEIKVKGASGDVAIAIPEGTPVWADVKAVSGTVRNEMPGVGAPQDGQPHVELHVTTVSGDIVVRPR